MTFRSSLAHRAKRALDVLGAGVGLLATSPILLASAVAVRVTMGSPMFFSQLRPGRHGKPFRIYKLRTMRHADGDKVWFRSDAERLTPLGAFLRKSSIDELPELFNVLQGNMSLVGPRPLLMEYLDKYTPEENRRHDVLPGITGWAQVNGRQSISFSERLRLDVWYVDNWSLALDLKILFMTVAQVFSGTDVLPGQNVDDVDDLGLSADRQRVGAA
ncbi:MAG: sugar transferase [Polyangiaceae bacterium]